MLKRLAALAAFALLPVAIGTLLFNGTLGDDWRPLARYGVAAIVLVSGIIILALSLSTFVGLKRQRVNAADEEAALQRVSSSPNQQAVLLIRRRSADTAFYRRLESKVGSGGTWVKLRPGELFAVACPTGSAQELETRLGRDAYGSFTIQPDQPGIYVCELELDMTIERTFIFISAPRFSVSLRVIPLFGRTGE